MGRCVTSSLDTFAKFIIDGQHWNIMYKTKSKGKYTGSLN